MPSHPAGQNRKRIVVVGSLNADLVQPLSRVPAPGETVWGQDLLVIPGGKGANQAVAAARLGGAVTMIGEVGHDHFGQLLLDSLKESAVDTVLVGRSSGSTGTACILVLPNGENLIVISPGANARLSEEKVCERLAETMGHSSPDDWILLCQLEVPLPAAALALTIAYSLGAVTILDPAPAQALDRNILSHVTYLTPNQTEAAILLGSKEVISTYEQAEEAARRLVTMGPNVVILKLGAMGCVVADGTSAYRVPGFEVNAVDTTAAGDTFNGAFAIALQEGRAIPEAVRFANAAAAISVTRPGAQSSIPDREAVNAFLQSRTTLLPGDPHVHCS